MIHSFLLIDQSNMAGRGFFNEAEDIDSISMCTYDEKLKKLH